MGRELEWVDGNGDVLEVVMGVDVEEIWEGGMDWVWVWGEG